MKTALTRSQAKAYSLATYQWEPFPAEHVTGNMLRSLVEKKLVLVKQFPCVWKRHGATSITKVSPFQQFLECVQNARSRATKKGLPCDLDNATAKKLWDRCGGCCEVSGIPFDFSGDKNEKRAFAPSIDRVNNRLGYTNGNVRVVCVAANIAMNTWGLETLKRLAEGVVEKHLSQGYPREIKTGT